ncbi:DUF6894 family protein [Microvirga sp. Mcv34]|uniref:DUF6894 family protein n=1 Tax=Microvirga sp. Mcv34 TaxID=2926016 RepID=UPI0039678578
MPKYFFNVVLNGHPTVDHHGREFRDHQEARTHAHSTAMLLVDHVRDQDSSFIAVSGEDGRLAFKIPFRPPSRG